MSDARKPPGRTVSSPGTPAVPGPASPGQARPAIRISNPNLKVLSAARPPPETEQKLAGLVRNTAENAALNAASVLKEAYTDFRRSDRYFKYKALIIASWVALSGITLVAACPTSELDAKNRLGARLAPRPADPTRPAVTIFNDSDDPWLDVVIVVNKEYRAAVPQVDARGYVTVTPKQLIGPGGKLAPADLHVVDVELRTDDGKTRLMKNGQEQ